MNDIQDQINSLFQRLKSLDPKERIAVLSSLKDSIEFSEPQLLPPLADSDDISKEDNIPGVAESQVDGMKMRTKLLPFQRKRFTLSSRKLISRQDEIPGRSIGRTGLTLSCPVCGLKATTWQKFSRHLHTGHSSAVISVCRRCNGIFKTRALLLAHECFLWGRKNLPCSAVYSSIDQSSRFLKKFGFPDAGIYFERRCGLCPASDVTFSSYEQFERHKYEEHADSTSTSPPFDTRRRKGLVFQGPPGQRLSRNLQSRFTCSNRPTSVQRTPERTLGLTHANSARMSTTTATKQLFFTSCAGRVVVHVHPIDQDGDATEAHHPSALPAVDGAEEKSEVSERTDHVCQFCSQSFMADTLLQEHIKSTHCLLEDNEACRAASESAVEGPDGISTISLAGALEETGSSGKLTETGEVGELTVESQPLKVVVCKLCRISFRNSDFLQRHERTSTQHAKKVKLLAKMRARIRKSQMNRQIVSAGQVAETATHIYCCTDCGLTYARKQSLDRHISVVHHHEATFVCEYCDFEASDRATFSEHMARHFHLKDVACEFCNHRCISKRELKDHILFKHQDERSYACPLCSKTFKTAGTLSRHRRTHTNISFTCELCSAKFNRQNNLTRHMRTVHTSNSLLRKRRGRRRAIRGTDSSSTGQSSLLPILPKSTSETEAIMPAAVEPQTADVTGAFGTIIDCNSLPPSESSVPVEVADFVSMTQDGVLPPDLSNQDVPQKSHPEVSESVYFVSCSPAQMSSFPSSVQTTSTTLLDNQSFSVTFPSADDHTSPDRERDVENGENVDVDALASEQSETPHVSLDHSPNEGPFRRLDLRKQSESKVPSDASHLSVLPCVSDLFFSDASTTATSSAFVVDSKDALHMCFSSDLAPTSSCSRPIWRPLDDLQPHNPTSNAPCSSLSSSSLTSSPPFSSSSTLTVDNFRVTFGDLVSAKSDEFKAVHLMYPAVDDSLPVTSVVGTYATGSPSFPSACESASPSGRGSGGDYLTDTTVSATQPSLACWQKSGPVSDLHCTLFEDSEQLALTSDFFVIPSGSLRVAKFSDMLPNLNSTPSGHTETMVDVSADQSKNHTDFSVGYLIGRDGSSAGVDGGGSGDGGVDCDGTMTAMHANTQSTLATSHYTFAPIFTSNVLPSLPTSDCLSLIPITNNFEDVPNATTDFSCNGYLL
nr:unnamed protein product [Spirometra erinaceieuropaei]